jgi:Cadherin domain/Bacterial cadherin-like domain
MVSISSNGGGSTAAFSLGENQSVVTTVAATGDGPIAYSISGGLDASKFVIDAQTGVLSFINAPNFEAPGDSGADNVYDVEVTASDGSLSASQALAITITNVNEAPVFTSATSFVALENGYSAALLAASDPEGSTITYSITGGEDYFKLYVNSQTGQLTFATAPNFEAPSDLGQDGTYKIDVRASDGTLFVTQTFSITIGNVNEGAMISSNGAGATAAFSVPENQLVATTVTARDNPVGTTVTFSITGGSDSSKFSINASTGVLSFVTAPNFESATDLNRDNVYEVTVRATDGTVSDTQALSITVANVNEPFSITSFGGGDTAQVSWSENSAGFTITTNDPDKVNLSFSIVGGADASRFAFSWANGKDGNFNFNAAPNFEAPGDVNGDNVYEVVIQASDGLYTDTQAVTFTIANVNEAPVITTNGGGASASISIAENGTAVTTVAATDPDGPTTFTYSLSGGADSSKFSINASTGALRFVNAPNFEVKSDVGANNVYDVIVKVSDGGALFDTQAIAVTVTNVNEAPVITSGGGGASASYSMAENAVFVAFASASDPESSTIFWSIVGGADASKFTINYAGAINLVPAPNYESPTDVGGNNVYDVVIQASDGVFNVTQAIAVTVTNVNEAPVITSDGAGATAALTVGENQTAVTLVASTDPENTARTYSISGGADAAKFSINATTGALSFVAAPNFESPTDSGANNVYDVVVKASDGSLFDTQAIAVTVANVNEAPVITSDGGGSTASLQVVENGQAATTVTSSDVDGPSASYAIAGGADAALFSIDSATGALSFLSAPDFEAPADSDLDNVYQVTVSASDGSLFDLQDITVSVTDIFDDPGQAMLAPDLYRAYSPLAPLTGEYLV